MITAKMKELFFDREAVTSATDAATRRVLSRFGAFVRTRARSSIRQAPKVDLATGKQLGRGRRQKGLKTRDAISEPGASPFSHTGAVKKLIYFAYDPATKSVVVGPELFGRGTVAALESGGEVRVAARGRRQGRLVFIRPRPFMQPAFEAELGENMPGMFADSIK